ncbi:MAG: DUF1810 domain-containing protein [Selenomonadaceae bacterium]|nr:DUF1810 domain-containing protein [Selenomonadaceae bacterium]
MAYDLSRFLKAQERDYDTALAEIKTGRKTSHWIWYIFPQLGKLGRSPTAKFYGIVDLNEARAYLANNLLRTRLIEISQALLNLPSNDIEDIMGYPDNLKLCSSMTLFHLAEPACDVFQKVLDKYFDGKPDKKTIALCKKGD